MLPDVVTCPYATVAPTPTVPSWQLRQWLLSEFTNGCMSVFLVFVVLVYSE
jgi:hypothetical protein